MRNLGRREKLFFVLGGFFLTNALVAELIGGKLIQVAGITLGSFELGPWPLSVGILPWPVVFLTTDLINEYYGQKGVRQISFLTAGLVLYAFLILFLTGGMPAVDFSPVDDATYQRVFLQSQWIMAGSLVAFLVSQFLDVWIFTRIRALTGKRYIWLRATGSTVVSQGIDTFLVQGIAFYLPGQISFEEWMSIALNSYVFKLGIALSITPLLYLGHAVIDRYLAKEL
ncbi:MAG: queuosine precursor transporter [Bacteroidetes bacterium]|nr:queuosine precursor transporter [Bacteroidota bacterium]